MKPKYWLVLLLCLAATAEQLPPLPMRSLSEHDVLLPGAARGRIAIIVASFTKAASTAAEAWRQKAEKDLASDPRYIVYEAAILEDVPRLIRGMVIGSIRKGTPAARQDRFLTTVQNEKTWKQLVHFSEPDDAYLLLVDPEGNLAWQAHGRFSEAQYATLHEQATQLAKQR